MDDGEGIGQVRVDSPQEEDAVLGSDVADLQRTNVRYLHHGIGRATFAAAEFPGWIRVYHLKARLEEMQLRDMRLRKTMAKKKSVS